MGLVDGEWVLDWGLGRGKGGGFVGLDSWVVEEDACLVLMNGKVAVVLAS